MCYVVNRIERNKEPVRDYLAPDGKSWVKSKATAKWFLTQVGAEAATESRPHTVVREYIPLLALFKLTRRLREDSDQSVLQGLLNDIGVRK